MDKAYEGGMRLGQTTPSYDGETEPTAAVPTEHLSLEQLQTTAAGFLGEGEQLPPIFSAVKVDGKRLYKSARAGKEVERKARPMRVEQYDITAFQNPEAEFAITCSKGTYVRTLVHDLGQQIGVGAWMTSLRRTSVGPYRLKDAWELANLVERLRIAAEQSSSETTPS
jgi:tRNA pseudouridine55 synthase